MKLQSIDVLMFQTLGWYVDVLLILKILVCNKQRKSPGEKDIETMKQKTEATDFNNIIIHSATGLHSQRLNLQ